MAASVPDDVPRGWLAWFTLVNDTVNALRQFGTTAQRPQAGLWIGRRYYDTSLGANGMPIWVDKTGTGWVDAAGNSV